MGDDIVGGVEFVGNGNELVGSIRGGIIEVKGVNEGVWVVRV